MSDRSVASMKKWGIPSSTGGKHGSAHGASAPEIALLERLVWVKYQTHWWPALLYHSYTELQQHLYDRLDMVLKAQFAMAIMRHMQEKKSIKVARLLGRPILEVIEVEDDCYCEFYWQLPSVLPKACSKSRYGGNTELYYDFHRALDQVEDIIRDVSQENFALMPKKDHQTWLERAKYYATEDPFSKRPPTPHPNKTKGKKKDKKVKKVENEKTEKNERGEKSSGEKIRSTRNPSAKGSNTKGPSEKTVNEKKGASADTPVVSKKERPKTPALEKSPSNDESSNGMWEMLKSYSQNFEESMANMIGSSAARATNDASDKRGNGANKKEHGASRDKERGEPASSKPSAETAIDAKIGPQDKVQQESQNSQSITPDASRDSATLRRPNVTGDEHTGIETELPMKKGKSRPSRRQGRKATPKQEPDQVDEIKNIPSYTGSYVTAQTGQTGQTGIVTEHAGNLSERSEKHEPLPTHVDESRDPESESAHQVSTQASTQTAAPSSRQASKLNSKLSSKSLSSKSVSSKHSSKQAAKQAPKQVAKPPPNASKALTVARAMSPVPSIASSALAVARARSPVNILPGLEGDDILPGLSDKVVHARDIWSNVWSQMMLTKGDEEGEQPWQSNNVESIRMAMQQQPSLLDQEVGGTTGRTSAKSGLPKGLTQPTEPPKKTDLALPEKTSATSFWQSMLGCNPNIY